MPSEIDEEINQPCRKLMEAIYDRKDIRNKKLAEERKEDGSIKCDKSWLKFVGIGVVVVTCWLNSELCDTRVLGSKSDQSFLKIRLD